ncbi:MAG: hypothetical protein GXO42_02465 [bacterium]|nr:hypothetical protein [bacterium]
MEDRELEEILRRKYEAYQKTAAKEAEIEQRKELLKRQLMQELFTADAREVLRNLELRGDSELVEQLIAWAKKMQAAGKLRGKIDKQQLQLLLKYIRQGEKRDWKISIKRK